MTALILSGVLGFLLASLVALFLAPTLWRRAVRLTTKTLHQQSPRTMHEGQADRDIMRAEFAVATRKLEVKYQQIKEKSTAQRIENTKLEEDKIKQDAQVQQLNEELKERNEQLSHLYSQVEALHSNALEREAKIGAIAAKKARKNTRASKLASALKRRKPKPGNENTPLQDPPLTASQENSSPIVPVLQATAPEVPGIQSTPSTPTAKPLRSDNSNHISSDTAQKNQSLAERIRSLQKDAP